MPANVGEMFYHGEVPWHGQGHKLKDPATMEEAIHFGGLDWEVETRPLMTNESPPSIAPMRVAIVRKDKKPGDRRRVLGVTHPGFTPLQNRQGIKVFDSIFGKGKGVYHTGGYLGKGEVVWVLARLPKTLEVAKDDTVNTYALFTNSHNGSIAIDIRLTTVRVVCQNTLSLALKKKARTVFKHSHQGNYSDLKTQMEGFFEDTLKAAAHVGEMFKGMFQRHFDDDQVKAYVEALFPRPQRKPGATRHPRAEALYAARVQKVQSIRSSVLDLAYQGRGSEIEGVQGSLWGAFNAVLEYEDHRAETTSDRLAYAMFGRGAAIKRRAFDLALQEIEQE